MKSKNIIAKKKVNFHNWEWWIIVAMISVICFCLLFGCKPPQSTPVKTYETTSDTIIKYKIISDTGLMNYGMLNYSDSNSINNAPYYEITIHDTVKVKQDCPVQFPNLKRAHNFQPVIITNSKVDTAAIISGFNRKGLIGKGDLKPTTNNGYTVKQLIPFTLISWLIFLLIGGVLGFIIRKK